MVPSDDAPSESPAAAKRPSRPAAAGAGAAEALVLVTLNASDGSILKVEAASPGGARHELSPAEAAQLLRETPPPTVKRLVHAAFEAGIACVLDDTPAAAAAGETSAESKEDAALYDELLDDLIEHSLAKRLLRREVLNSALLGTIISEASGAGAAPAE